MGKATGIIKIAYYLGKLVLSAFWVYPYLRWRIWRAKHAFKRELKKGGLRDDLVHSLVQDYNRQNRKVIGLVSRGFDAVTDFDVNVRLRRRT